MPLWVVLVGLCVASLLVKSRCAVTTSAALLGNWGANTVLASFTGSQFCWPIMSAIDFLTAAILLSCPLSLFGLGVVVLYAGELIAHAAFAFSDEGPWPQYEYWYVLHYAAWAQAWLVAAWVGFDGGKAVLNRSHPGGRLLSIAEVRSARRVSRWED